MKRSNGFHSTGMMDPRRELADSLPLCHPNDDYLKDFTPMNGKCLQCICHELLFEITCEFYSYHSIVHDDQQPSTSSNVQEGVLTWV